MLGFEARGRSLPSRLARVTGVKVFKTSAERIAANWLRNKTPISAGGRRTLSWSGRLELITTLALDDEGRPLLVVEDQAGNRDWRRIDPNDIPAELEAEHKRLLADYRDSLEGGHEAAARHAYLRAIGGIAGR